MLYAIFISYVLVMLDTNRKSVNCG